MTPEQIVDDMANKTEHDDAYIEMLGKEFASLGIEGLEKFVDAFNARKSSFTPEQQQNISRVNHALAKNAGFCEALKSLHDHREAQMKAKAEQP